MQRVFLPPIRCVQVASRCCRYLVFPCNPFGVRDSLLSLVTLFFQDSHIRVQSVDHATIVTKRPQALETPGRVLSGVNLSPQLKLLDYFATVVFKKIVFPSVIPACLNFFCRKAVKLKPNTNASRKRDRLLGFRWGCWALRL